MSENDKLDYENEVQDPVQTVAEEYSGCPFVQKRNKAVVCEVCGHINKGNSAICEMCSNYLFD